MGYLDELFENRAARILEGTTAEALAALSALEALTSSDGFTIVGSDTVMQLERLPVSWSTPPGLPPFVIVPGEREYRGRLVSSDGKMKIAVKRVDALGLAPWLIFPGEVLSADEAAKRSANVTNEARRTAAIQARALAQNADVSFAVFDYIKQGFSDFFDKVGSVLGVGAGVVLVFVAIAGLVAFVWLRRGVG